MRKTAPYQPAAHPEILIAAAAYNENVRGALKSARARGLPIRAVNFTDPAALPPAGSILFWRDGALTKQAPQALARTAFLRAALAREVRVVNPGLATMPEVTRKAYQQWYVQLCTKGLRGIPTYLAPSEEALQQLERAQMLRRPYIAKPNFGMCGEKIVFIQNDADRARLEKYKEYVFQNYVPNQGDFRAFVVGGVCVDVLKRHPTHASFLHLNNISRGAVASAMPRDERYWEIARIAERVARLFDLGMCGVDVIQDADSGTWYFLEVNTCADWGGGFLPVRTVRVEEEIADMLARMWRRTTHPAEESVVRVRRFMDDKYQLLPPAARVHYLTRMYTWTKEQKYLRALEEFREEYTSPDTIDEAARQAFAPRAAAAPHADTAKTPRKKVLRRRYPKLAAINRLLFKLLWNETVWGRAHAARVFAEKKYRDEVLRYARKLAASPGDVLALSTHGVNFLFLSHFFLPEVAVPDTAFFIEASRRTLRGACPRTLLRARVYTLTHVIIGASKFYARRFSAQERAALLPLLKELEMLIGSHYQRTSLDMKFEFLVCCRLLRCATALERRIWDEADASLAPWGDYYLDVHNEYAQATRSLGFSSMEHRCVLAIMASLPRAK